jgi:hypothetical protein
MKAGLTQWGVHLPAPRLWPARIPSAWKPMGPTNVAFGMSVVGTLLGDLLLVGKDPIGAVAAECYLAAMGLILLILVLFILFGGGGFYFGGPLIGGGGLGLVLLICLIIYLMGGFRSKA